MACPIMFQLELATVGEGWVCGMFTVREREREREIVRPESGEHAIVVLLYLHLHLDGFD